MKYLKYYLSTLLLLLTIYISAIGSHAPTVFFISISFLIILGDIYLGKDVTIEKYSYPYLINFPIYINLFLLMILVTMVVYIFGNQSSLWLVDIFNSYLFIYIVQSIKPIIIKIIPSHAFLFPLYLFISYLLITCLLISLFIIHIFIY